SSWVCRANASKSARSGNWPTYVANVWARRAGVLTRTASSSCCSNDRCASTVAMGSSVDGKGKAPPEAVPYEEVRTGARGLRCGWEVRKAWIGDVGAVQGEPT